MDVSVLVVTWNNATDIEACLDAALAQRDVALEVIVVDNASTDGTTEVLRKRTDEGRVRVVENTSNVGYADANSQAARLATGRHLLLLNPDCEMAPDCARVLVDHLERTPGCGAAAAALSYPDGSPQAFLRRDVSPGVAVWGFLEVGRRVDARFLGGRKLQHRIYGDVELAAMAAPFEVDCPAAACVLLPRVLAGERLFDPSYPLFFNDADLYRRLRDRAYTVQVAPSARATHRYGASVNTVPPERLRAETVLSLRRYVRGRWRLLPRYAFWWLLLADALLCLSRRQTRVVGRGTLGGLGLPGGARPWLSRRGGTARVPSQAKQAARQGLSGVSRRWRRRSFITKARWGAVLSAARLDLDVARDADLPRRVRFEFGYGQPASLSIGRGVLVRPDLVLRLRGALVVEDRCEIRQGVVLNVKGRLQLSRRTVLGRGATVHADGDMVWEWGATSGEFVTVLDSHHVVDGSVVHPFDQPVEVAPVVIGASALLGAQSVVLPGVRVGRGAVVAAGAVVTKDVPDATVVVGVPAREQRGLRAPAPPAARRNAAPRRR